ncbi:uncharacterized protein [Malus domestica]|uniref:uncharacterized protein isoform X3 n=1 Tax=Malus domestica TaxID=3750 RepID=UPI0039755EC1
MRSPKLCKSEKKDRTNHHESPDPRAQRSSSVPNLAIAADLTSGKKIASWWSAHISARNKRKDVFSEITNPNKQQDTRIQCIAERRERSKPRSSGPQKGKRNSNVSASANSGRTRSWTLDVLSFVHPASACPHSQDP